MIVSIRGTSGSGKSTLVRKVMELYPERHPKFIDGRKQPIAYTMTNHWDTPLAVIGHYESPCGGCDTIQEFDEVFRLVREYADQNYNVLFEGVLLYSELPRTIALVQELYPIHVIALNTPIEDCLLGVQMRRWEKGDATPVPPKNTTGKYNGTITSMARLVEGGVPFSWESRESAFLKIKQLLNLP